MECEWTAIENPADSRCGRPDLIGLENQRHLTSSPWTLSSGSSIIAGRHSSYLPLVIYGVAGGGGETFITPGKDSGASELIRENEYHRFYLLLPGMAALLPLVGGVH